MKKFIDFLTATITRPFNKWSDKTLAAGTKAIVEAMTGNLNFPTTEPTIADYAVVVDDFAVVLGKAKLRDVNAVNAKNVKRAELIGQTVALGNSVSQLANGDLAMLGSTAFPLRKARQKVVLTNPQNLRIVNGKNKGELIARVNGMRGARSFVFSRTQDPIGKESSWTDSNCSTAQCTITGLEPGTRYWFKAGAVGSNGQVLWSETILSPYVQ